MDGRTKEGSTRNELSSSKPTTEVLDCDFLIVRPSFRRLSRPARCITALSVQPHKVGMEGDRFSAAVDGVKHLRDRSTSGRVSGSKRADPLKPKPNSWNSEIQDGTALAYSQQTNVQ